MESTTNEQPAECVAAGVDALITARARAAEEVDEARQALDSRMADLDALDRAIEIVQRQGHGGSPITTTTRKVEADIDLSGICIDFTGTENLKERLIQIAEAVPDMHLNVTETGKLLLRHGVTQATLHNARVSVQRTFDGHPDLFERVETHRATYRYIGAQGDGPSQDAVEAGSGGPEQEVQT